MKSTSSGFIVQFQGGLGNQLFQYALGRSLSLTKYVPVKFDLTWYQTQSKRKYELAPFKVAVVPATEVEIGKLLWHKKIAGSHLKLMGFLSRFNRRYIREKDFSFDPEILQLEPPAYLEGWWQWMSEQYFSQIRDVLLTDLQLKKPLQGKNLATAKKIMATESVSLHIRRGDYVAEKSTNQFHGVCGLDYYDRAVRHIKKHVSSPSYFVFSDDIQWAKENLKLGNNTTFIDWNQGDNGYLDLCLMQQCKHNIIANSSFSWWGAWLNDHPGKIVIAPKKWFNDTSVDTSDLIPPGWIRV